MKKRYKFVLAVLGLLLLTAVALSLDFARHIFAQESDDAEVEATATPEAAVTTTDEHVFGMYPQQAVQDALDTAVADGVLSQDEADGILANVEENSGDFRGTHIEIRPFGRGGGHFSGRGFPGGPGGLFGALRQAKQDGILTDEDVQAIMADFAGIAGDGVTVEFDGENGDDFRIQIEGIQAEMEAAMEQALDNAVADGRLTAEESAQILDNIQAVPHPESFMFGLPPGIDEFDFDFHGPSFFGHGQGRFQMHDGMIDTLTQHLEQAVEDGRLTQSEMDAVLDALSNLTEE